MELDAMSVIDALSRKLGEKEKDLVIARLEMNELYNQLVTKQNDIDKLRMLLEESKQLVEPPKMRAASSDGYPQEEMGG